MAWPLNGNLLDLVHKLEVVVEKGDIIHGEDESSLGPAPEQNMEHRDEEFVGVVLNNELVDAVGDADTANDELQSFGIDRVDEEVSKNVYTSTSSQSISTDSVEGNILPEDLDLDLAQTPQFMSTNETGHNDSADALFYGCSISSHLTSSCSTAESLPGMYPPGQIDAARPQTFSPDILEPESGNSDKKYLSSHPMPAIEFRDAIVGDPFIPDTFDAQLQALPFIRGHDVSANKVTNSCNFDAHPPQFPIKEFQEEKKIVSIISEKLDGQQHQNPATGYLGPSQDVADVIPDFTCCKDGEKAVMEAESLFPKGGFVNMKSTPWAWAMSFPSLFPPSLHNGVWAIFGDPTYHFIANVIRVQRLLNGVNG
jgi:hypothetical protein